MIKALYLLFSGKYTSAYEMIWVSGVLFSFHVFHGVYGMFLLRHGGKGGEFSRMIA